MAADDDFDRLAQRAAALRQAGRVPEAITAYEALLERSPRLPNSWYNLAWLRRRAQQPEAALAAYQQALDHGIAQPEEVHLNRGVIYSDDLRRPEDAARELHAALRLNPRYVPALLNLGNLHEDLGERDAARAQYEQALALEPGRADALARLAGVSTIADPADALAVRLRQVLSRPGLAPAARAELGFALARLLDGCGAYDEAFKAATQAKRDSRASARPGARYDRAAAEAEVDALIQAFPSTTSPRGAGTRPPPIFICGMFRSGSTLVEQVLAAHPRVTAGGELPLLPALVAGPLAPFPASMARLDAAALAAHAADHRGRLAALFPGADVVTDKRPDNFRYIGLIKTLFPDARIVHTRRHPLDNLLSMHFLHLSHAMPYALDLLDSAHHLRQYRRLMAHWQALYGRDILDLDYDAFVHAPRAGTERLLQFCGLDWDERCLSFHQVRNAVRTASVWQVREPLYTRASGRWRHYQAQLAPVQVALQDLLDAAPGQPL